MGNEADSICGAPYRQPSQDRVNHLNGYRSRRWDTRVGTIDLAIPRLRKGSYYPDGSSILAGDPSGPWFRWVIPGNSGDANHISGLN